MKQCKKIELPNKNFTDNYEYPSQQCYAGPMRALRGLPVQEPYRFGCGRCSGPTWANSTGLIWLSILSRNQKFKHANKLTFLIISKKNFLHK